MLTSVLEAGSAARTKPKGVGEEHAASNNLAM